MLLKSKSLGFQGIYVITTEDGWPSKVGITYNLLERTNQLQVGNWHKIRAAHFAFAFGARDGVASGDFSAARHSVANLERAAHIQLEDLVGRLNGEWFDIDAADAWAVVNKVSGDMGYRLVPYDAILRFDPSQVTRTDDRAALHDLVAVAGIAKSTIEGFAC